MEHRRPSLAIHFSLAALASLGSFSVLAATPPPPTSVTVKLPCGGTYYPDCESVLKGSGVPAGKILADGSVAVVGVIPQIEGRISRMVDGIYQGKWLDFIVNTGTGEVVQDNSKKFAVPAHPEKDKPGICSPLPLKLHIDPTTQKVGTVCKSDQNFNLNDNVNSLGESCGELAAVFPNDTGNDYTTPLRGAGRDRYFGRETSYMAGSLAVALAHNYYQLKEQLEKNQQITVTDAACIEPALKLNQSISTLDAFRQQPVADQKGATQDILIHLKKGCDDKNISNCPTRDYLEAAYSHVQQALVTLAVCTINGNAASSYRKFQGELFDELLAQAVEPCVRSNGGALRATQSCYSGKFQDYWKSAVTSKWPMALKGCSP